MTLPEKTQQKRPSNFSSLPKSTAAAAQARAAGTPSAPSGVPQTGTYYPAGLRRRGNSGDNQVARFGAAANNFQTVMEDGSALLRSAAYTGFTFSHEMTTVRDGALDGGLWSDVFPPDREAVMTAAGWLLFCGDLPADAFRAAVETSRSERGAAEPVFRAAAEAAIAAEWPPHLPYDADAVRTGTDAIASVIAADVQHFVPPSGPADGPDAAAAASDFMHARAGPERFLPEDVLAAWGRCAAESLLREHAAVEAARSGLTADLASVAAAWMSVRESQYLAEHEIPPHGGNPFVGTFRERAVRELAGIWPDNEIWNRQSWIHSDRARVSDTGRPDERIRSPLTPRQATIRSAVERIMGFVAADTQTVPLRDAEGELVRERLAPEDAYARMGKTAEKIHLHERDPAEAAGERIPAAAAATFRKLAWQYVDEVFQSYTA